MPNYVKNVVTIEGSVKRRTELGRLLKSGDNVFDFENIIPTPKSLLNVDATTASAIAQRIAKYKYEHAEDKTAVLDEIVEVPDLCFPVHATVSYLINQLKEDEMYNALDISQVPQYLENIEKYGYPHWYDWRVLNWGTKWNSCDADGDVLDGYEFDTAYSMPELIYRKISKMFPTLKIHVKYADENVYGDNCGSVCFKNGEVIEDEPISDKFQFSCDLLGLDVDDYTE